MNADDAAAATRAADPILSGRLAGFDPNLVGIVAMTAASAAFVVSDTFVKLASEAMGIGQLLTVRSAFATIFTLIVAFAVGAFAKWRTLGQPLVVGRGLLEAAAAYLFISGLERLPLAEVSAIFQVVPLMVTGLSVVVYRETVGWRRWTAILVGFVGVMLIIQPSAQGVNAGALLVLASAFVVAVRDLVTRGIHRSTPSALVTVTTMAAVSAAGIALTPFTGGWTPLAGVMWLYLAASAATVAIGSFMIIVAMRVGEAPAVSPFRYTILLFAALLSYGVWGYVPNALACFGAGLVIASGLYTIHREVMRARAAKNAAHSRHAA